MRPLLLKMTAFGPFPALETIDFSTLGDNPLFLINGPTGSGKTTILDAICFALYGKTTGDERNGAQMRCDLAASELLCEVTFEFELDGHLYRIRRVPEQLRPKARGEGMTEQKPEAQLIELSSDGGEVLHVAAKVSDATCRIEELTGLSVDQFRQVMILPQGKFRQLLLAESAEREKIFSKLFQTQIYKQLEFRLKEQAAQVRRERENLRQQQLGILEAIEVESADQLEVEIEALQPQVAVALTAKQQAEARFVEANNTLQQGESLLGEFKRFEQIETELLQLNDRQVQIDLLRQKLDNALAAEQLRPLFVEWQRCRDEVQKAAKSQQKLEKEFIGSREKLADTQQQLQRIEPLDQELDRCKVEISQLGEQKEKVKRLEKVGELLSTLQCRVAAFAQLGAVAKKEEQLQLVKEFKSLSSELSRLNTQLEREKQAGQQLAQRQQQQTKETRQLEIAWHCGQAAILAAELQDEQPCPVCGSLDHPTPAHSASPLPSQHDLEKVRQELQATTMQLETARDRYRETAAKREQLQGQTCRIGATA